MNARERWLASLPSMHTRTYYAQVFDIFWSRVRSRYSPPRGMDSFDWLAEHRRLEIKRGSLDPLHCEKIVALWIESLKETDLAPRSRTTYVRDVSSFFRHLLAQKRSRLRLRDLS